MTQSDLFGYERQWPRQAVATMRAHLWLADQPPRGTVRNELSVWKELMNRESVRGWPYDSGHEALMVACRNLHAYCALKEDWSVGPCSARIFWTDGGQLLQAVLGYVEKGRAWRREAHEPTQIGSMLDRVLAMNPLTERSER